MVLRLGDALPAECTPVTDLVPGLLAVPEGVLVEVPGTDETGRGKLLLASRAADYVAAFAAQGVTVCEDQVPPFAQASTLLRLPLIGQDPCPEPYRLGIYGNTKSGAGVPYPDPIGLGVDLAVGGGPFVAGGTGHPSPGSYVGNLWRIRRVFVAFHYTTSGDVVEDARDESDVAGGTVAADNTLTYGSFTCDDVVQVDPGTGTYFNASISYILEVQCHGEWRHCSGPASQNQSGNYATVDSDHLHGYFGLVEGAAPQVYLFAGVGPYVAGTYHVGGGYAGQAWRIISYVWKDSGDSTTVLNSGTVPDDGFVVYGSGTLAGVGFYDPGFGPMSGDANVGITARIEVQCGGVWPDPPSRPF